MSTSQENSTDVTLCFSIALPYDYTTLARIYHIIYTYTIYIRVYSALQELSSAARHNQAEIWSHHQKYFDETNIIRLQMYVSFESQT